MSGSLEAVLGPAALRFLRPMRVVGGGGGSYLGLSFFLSLSSLPSPGWPPPMLDCWLPFGVSARITSRKQHQTNHSPKSKRTD
ncbi:hypothetical protein BDV18DRAFT_135934 [Aspergillus unguis]